MRWPVGRVLASVGGASVGAARATRPGGERSARQVEAVGDGRFRTASVRATALRAPEVWAVLARQQPGGVCSVGVALRSAL